MTIILPSDDDGEIDEIVSTLDISDEEANDYQSITKQTWTINKKPSYEFYIKE